MVKIPGVRTAPIAQARRRTSRLTAIAFDTRPSRPGQEPVQRRVARQGVAASQALGRLVFQKRDVGDEVTTGQLELDDRAVALTTGVPARPDRAQVPAIGGVDQAQVVQRLTEQGDARHRRHVVFGRLDCDRRHSLP